MFTIHDLILGFDLIFKISFIRCILLVFYINYDSGFFW